MFKPKATLRQGYWAASDSGVGKVVALTAVEGRGFRATIRDSKTLGDITVEPEQLVPAPSHREFLKNKKDNTWIRVMVREHDGCVCRDILLATAQDDVDQDGYLRSGGNKEPEVVLDPNQSSGKYADRMRYLYNHMRCLYYRMRCSYNHMRCLYYRMRYTGKVVSKKDDPVDEYCPKTISPYMVVDEPDKFLEVFCECWEGVVVKDFGRLNTVDASQVMFWIDKHRERRGHTKQKPRKGHRFLPGLCKTWANASADFCISCNMWCVIFRMPNGDEADMVVYFIIAFWVKYCSLMVGLPGLQSDSCQMVLKYLLTHRKAVAQTWRARLYFYSSGSVFKKILPPLTEWLGDDKQREKILLKLKDEEGLYKKLADVMFAFIQAKPAPFPHAMISQECFWEVPSWKRAMVFVFLLRQAFDDYASRPWKDYDYDDYVFNKRAFKRWSAHEKDVMNACTELKKMDVTSPRRAKRKLRPISSSQEKTRKKVFVIDIDSD